MNSLNDRLSSERIGLSSSEGFVDSSSWTSQVAEPRKSDDSLTCSVRLKLPFKRCSHSARSRVYETVECPSVCPIVRPEPAAGTEAGDRSMQECSDDGLHVDIN